MATPYESKLARIQELYAAAEQLEQDGQCDRARKARAEADVRVIKLQIQDLRETADAFERDGKAYLALAIRRDALQALLNHTPGRLHKR